MEWYGETGEGSEAAGSSSGHPAAAEPAHGRAVPQASPEARRIVHKKGVDRINNPGKPKRRCFSTGAGTDAPLFCWDWASRRLFMPPLRTVEPRLDSSRMQTRFRLHEGATDGEGTPSRSAFLHPLAVSRSYEAPCSFPVAQTWPTVLVFSPASAPSLDRDKQ